MRNDVSTLIAALTTERNSIDRAITALKAMSNGQPSAPTVPAAPKGKMRRKPSGPKAVISNETKAAIVAHMRQPHVGTLAEMERQAVRDFGVKVQTVAVSWRKWARDLKLTDQPVIAEPSTPAPEPAL